MTLLPIRAFSNRTLCDLEAGPESLSLRELSPYFYRLGEKCSVMSPKDNCAQLMKRAFLSRVQYISRPITMPSESKYVGGFGQTIDPHRSIYHTQGHTFTSRLDHDEEVRIILPR